MKSPSEDKSNLAHALKPHQNIPIVVPIDTNLTAILGNEFESGEAASSIPSQQASPVDDQYIVFLNPDAVSALDSPSYVRGGQDNNAVRTLAAEAARDGGQIIEVYDSLNGYAVRAPEDPEFVERLSNDPRIAYIEQDQRVYALNHMQSLPTGINRIDGDLSGAQSGDGTGSVNVDVAVLDSGIDLTHPDLNVYKADTFVSGTTSANDDNGHGTLVAGIIGAKDDHAGVVGVAPGARLWAVKVLDKSGTGMISDIIAGIDYIVQNAKEIEAANLSFGCECSSTALDAAINKAVSAGITFAAAAGNSAKNANSFSPANNPNVIAVSAIADSDGKCGATGPATKYGGDDSFASFSNYGTTVSMASPGVDILSTSMNGGYAKMSGTSAAAPHVAGAAALYKAANPSASPVQVKSGLISNAVKSSTGTCDGNGFGYFSGDKDTAHEPLLNVRGLGPSTNQPPTADSKSVSTNYDTAVDITLSGKDSENDQLSFKIVDLAKNGMLSPVSGNTVTYTPNTGFVGQDSFTFVALDSEGLSSSNKATITITVNELADGGDTDITGSLSHKRQTSSGSSSWSAFESMGTGIRSNSNLALAMNSDGRLQVFVVGTNNQLNYKTQSAAGSSTWSSTWTSLGGTVKADTSPAVARNSDGRLQVFIIGSDNILYYKTQSAAGGSVWSSSWVPLGGPIRANTDPVALSIADGRLYVFVVGTNNQLYYRAQSVAGSSTWSPTWTTLGGTVKENTSPAVARNSDGRLQAFVVGTNNQLYYKTQSAASGSTWSSGWTSLGGSVKADTSPAVARNSDGRLQVFFIGSDSILYSKSQISAGSSSWSWRWVSLGGPIRANTDPVALSIADGRLYVFVVGTNNQLYYRAQSVAGSSTWSSNWTSLGGNLRADTEPAAIRDSIGRLEVFVIGP